jgi:hypothetical protein
MVDTTVQLFSGMEKALLNVVIPHDGVVDTLHFLWEFRHNFNEAPGLSVT